MADVAELAQVAASAMVQAGSDVMFGVPGGGNNLELIGAAQAAGIRFVLTHTETAAACMAGVYSELSRTPTGCVVTRGPGAASSVNGVAQALLDRQPVIVFSDAVSAAERVRISHQRLDQESLFAPITKWSTCLGAAGPADTMRRAIDAAISPRPGPVHLDIDPSSSRHFSPPPSVQRVGSMSAVNDVLAGSTNPVVVLGVGARHSAAAIRELLAGTAIPVLQTYKAAGVVADSSPNAAGLMTGATIEAPVLAAADAIVAIGLDSVELIPASWPYAAPVLSLSEWPEDSAYFESVHEVVGPLDELIGDIDPMKDGWDADYAQQHRKRGLDMLVDGPAPRDGLAPWQVVQCIRTVAPAGSVATVDAGAHMLVAMPLWATENPGELLVSSGLATMGFALPAAISAALRWPDERVFCFVGDGGLGMVLAELETLARLALRVTVVVFNDSLLSLIKIKQKPHGHGGEAAVAYRATDFAAVANGCGVAAARVMTEADLIDAAGKSLTESGPVLLDVLVDPSGYPHVLDAIRGSRS
jgi:acetolactate synthase I/II/III large subunit